MYKVIAHICWGLIFSCLALPAVAANHHLAVNHRAVNHAVLGLVRPAPYTIIAPPQNEKYRKQALHWLHALQQQHALDTQDKIAFIARQLGTIPYQAIGANGEGDWDPDYMTNRRSGAWHINQEPVYRTDGFNCQTLVTFVLALLASHQDVQFEPNIIRINYGAAGIPGKPYVIHYYNRNNFTSVDFNPVNERHGYIKNITLPKFFPHATQKITASILRDKWFALQGDTQHLHNTVRVFDKKIGLAMSGRMQHYPPAAVRRYIAAKQLASVTYIPLLQSNKTQGLFLQSKSGDYTPNAALFKRLAHYAAPAVIEIVRDPNKWHINGKKISIKVGSPVIISHMGVIYNHHFNRGDLIANEVICHRTVHAKQRCEVEHQLCRKKLGCQRLMMLQATDAYPNSFVFWQGKDDVRHCTSLAEAQQETKVRAHTKRFISCNRVVALRLQDYLAQQLSLGEASLLGVHFEKIEI